MQKDRATTLFLKNFLSSKLILLHLRKLYWQLRREKLFMPKGRTHSGELLFGQRKNIWKKERESFKLRKCFWKSYSYTLGQLQMNSKRFYQKICKNKLSGENVVQIFIYVKNIHMYKSQTSYNSAFYICFGLCWHQSRKSGRLKGK